MIRNSFIAFGVLALSCSPVSIAVAHAASDAKTVTRHYVEIGHAKFEDSLTAAKALQAAVDALASDPTDETLSAARSAWRAARIPYAQTEVYRFANPVLDEWEPGVNSWPLDEGLIDYVAGAYGTENEENEYYTANIIANPKLMVGGKELDATSITPEFLRNSLQSVGDVESNVATGYHAIEFLLWGQDLNGTGPGGGNRPASDFSLTACTNGNCDRRVAYLKAATQLLVSDLEVMEKAWAPGGAAEKVVTEDPEKGLAVMLTGMGSLTYGELVGERMNIGLLLHDPEEEQDCFSDNTVYSHFYDAKGIADTYAGTYSRLDGTVMNGPSLSDLVKARDPALDGEMHAKLDQTMIALTDMVKRGETVEAYDQMLGEGNKEGNAVVQTAMDRLTDQTKTIERLFVSLGVAKVQTEDSGEAQ